MAVEIRATATEPTERTVALQMPESEARRLKYLLMNNVTWEEDRFGRTAQRVYDALDHIDVSESAARGE